MKKLVREPLGWFLLALALRLTMVAWASDRVPPTADGSFYHVVAQRIAHGDGYTWLWPDGAVTYAAHYPVGYPALLGAVYWLVGSQVAAAMVMNAVIGAFGAALVFAITKRWLAAEERSVGIRSARIAALLYSFSPTLVCYTPALMTEGVVATMLLGAIAVAGRVRDSERISARLAWISLLGVLLGTACLVRPQCSLLAPVLGYFSWPREPRQTFLRRCGAALLVSSLAILTVSPWTFRNCEKMESCVFVSANGGWNLLIGTYPEGHGSWVPIDGERVPEECRDVFQEAKKDACFGAAGRRRALDNFAPWVGLAPEKWRVTFDFTGAAADHLHAAGALSSQAKWWLAALEIVSHRLLGLFAWFALMRLAAPHLGARFRLLLTAGALVLLASAAYASFAALCLAGVAGLRRLDRPELQVPLWTLLATFVVHAVFFGAGRYFLPILAVLAPLGGYGLAGLRRTFDSA